MIIALANRMAHALLLGCSGNEMIYPLDDLIDAIGFHLAAFVFGKQRRGFGRLA